MKASQNTMTHVYVSGFVPLQTSPVFQLVPAARGWKPLTMATEEFRLQYFAWNNMLVRSRQLIKKWNMKVRWINFFNAVLIPKKR
jgi:hypothetical protein